MSTYLGSSPTNVVKTLFRSQEAIALYIGTRQLGSEFAPEFSLLDLFAGGKQGVWYDPSDKSTLFQDVAGTVPVTKDGDPVALMKDKSGNGNHATQSVSAARPVYKTDGDLHWLSFDEVDDFLIMGLLKSMPQPTGYGMAIKESKLKTGTSYIKTGALTFDRYATRYRRIFHTGAVYIDYNPLDSVLYGYTASNGSSYLMVNSNKYQFSSTTSSDDIPASDYEILRGAGARLYGFVMSVSPSVLQQSDTRNYLATKSGVTL